MASGRSEQHTYGNVLQYRQIRLTLIQAGPADTPIRCYPTTAWLDRDTPPFVALSYAWGQPNRDTQIYVDDKVAYITPNLAAFIRQLCLLGRNDGVLFWVDAVCIDQRNKEEKTQQVKLMKDIFRKCSECFCWLGPALSMDEEGITLLKTLTTELKDQSPDFEEAKARQSQIFQHLRLPPKRSIPWRGLKSIQRRPWFGRSWIIEECLLPPKATAFLGHRHLDFDLLLQFGAICLKLREINLALDLAVPDPSLPRPPAEIASNMVTLIKIRRMVDQKSSIFHLQYLTTQFFSYDPRDRVYSLVAFADHFDQTLIDYDNLTARELFIRLTKLGLCNALGRESWKLLCYARGGDRPSIADLPSWAIDFASGKFKATLEPYFATIIDPGLPLLSFQDPNVLCISGRVLDRVKLIRHQPNKGLPHDLYEAKSDIEKKDIEKKRVAFLAECERIILSLPNYPTGQSLTQVACSVFLNGKEFPTTSPAYDAHPLAFSQLFNHHWFPEARGCNMQHSKQDTDKAYDSFVSLYSPIALLSFFLTERGYVGFTHENATEGDFLCVFQGYRLPFALRAKGRQYELLGDAYLHGCMNYEAHRASHLSWQTVEIV